MYVVVVNEDNILREVVCVTKDAKVAEDHFLDACKTNSSNWDEYEIEDVAAFLEDAYYQFGNQAVVLMDVSNVKSDAEILAELAKTPPPGVHKITNWIRSGEIGEVDTIEEVIGRAGTLLDKACSHEIFGDVVFGAEDGKVYVLTCEGQVGLIAKDYLEQIRDEDNDG